MLATHTSCATSMAIAATSAIAVIAAHTSVSSQPIVLACALWLMMGQVETRSRASNRDLRYYKLRVSIWANMQRVQHWTAQALLSDATFFE